MKMARLSFQKTDHNFLEKERLTVAPAVFFVLDDVVDLRDRFDVPLVLGVFLLSAMYVLIIPMVYLRRELSILTIS